MAPASTVPTSGRRRSAAHWGAYTAIVEDGRLVGVEPFTKDRNPSPLIESMPEIVHHETRIRQPMARSGWLRRDRAADRRRRGAESFVPLSWDAAIELVADELARVREAHSNEAVFGGSYGWASAGRFHHARTQLHRFLNSFGGFTSQVTNYSFGAGMVLLPHIVGSNEAVSGPVTSYASIAANTRLLVAFGGLPLKNAQIDSGGLGEHAVEGWLDRIAAAGVELVCIAPIRDDLAAMPEVETIRPRPTTDAAIMLGLAHTLVAEGLHDRAFLERCCTGHERWLAYLMGATDGRPKDADWAAAIAEVDAESLRSLARRMASTRTMLTASWSVQRCDHGEQPYWAMVALAALLGQIGLPGGGFAFGYGSTGGMGTPRPRVPSPKLEAGTNPADSFIPVARIADMLLAPGHSYDFNGERRRYPDVRMIYWAGGNPFHHHQDLNRLLAAWRKPETIVVHEPWWTATARHADIVLPATTALERNDIAACTRDKYVMAMEKAVAPVAGALDDFEIFLRLAERLGIAEGFAEGRDEEAWLRHIYAGARAEAARAGVEMAGFDDFWEAGYLEHAEPAPPYDMLADFRADPLAHPLPTPSGKIEIFSETIAGFGYADCPGHPAWLEPVEWLGSPMARRFPLHLVSNQPRTRLHAQLDPGRVSRESKIAGREPVWLHPRDARARGIRQGDVVRVYNDRGACLAGAHVTESVRAGVVQLSTGAWYDPLAGGQPGTLEVHGNPNVLTLDKGASRLSQATSAMSCLVEIERFDGEPPAVRAWQPPAMETDGV